MNNRASLIVILAAAALVVVAAGTRYKQWISHVAHVQPEKASVQLLREAKPVPSVTMATIDGRSISTAELAGKVVIVNFWATWCPPCRAEIPDLVALQTKYRDQLLVIGVSDDEGGPSVVKAFAEQYQINYPLVMNTPEIRRAFTGVSALPTSFVVDREGKIVQKHVGLLNGPQTELETRYLAGLENSASVEYVEDSNQMLIKNAAQATKIPGLDLEKLSPAVRTEVLQRLNSEKCTCGCDLTLAACRINDPSCNISLPIAMKMVAEAGAPAGAASAAH